MIMVAIKAVIRVSVNMVGDAYSWRCATSSRHSDVQDLQGHLQGVSSAAHATAPSSHINIFFTTLFAPRCVVHPINDS